METTRRPCCGGLDECFAWCELGQELARLERDLMRRGVIRRDDDNDASDRAWVNYSEAV